MSVFVDSSALVKLYADEVGHDAVRQLGGPLIVSQLARVEVPAALWRKERLGEISPQEARLLCRDFEADLFGDEVDSPRFAAVAPVASILDRAARLCASHPLRAYDSVQLASAVEVRAAEPSCTELAAFDTQLRRAAAAEGFGLVPADGETSP